MDEHFVTIDEEPTLAPRVGGRKKRETVSEWLIRKKIAKSPIQASYVLLGLFVALIVASVIALILANAKPVAPTAAQQRQFRLMNSQQ